MVGKKSPGDSIFNGINYTVLIIIIFTTLYPFYYVLIQSFNKGINALNGGIYLWPKNFTLENYQIFFTDPKWLNAMLISVLRTVVGTILGVFFTCMVSYGLSFKKLTFRKFYTTVLIISMYFSGGIIPYYVVLKNLHLFNTFWVYVIPMALNVFFVFVGISFFSEIPSEIFESAYVDGANDLTIFLKLVLPVSKPFLATIALFMGVEQWNAWFDAAFFVKDKSLHTLSFLMMEIINKTQLGGNVGAGAAARRSISVTSFSLQTSAMIIAVAPIVCVYPFLQKYFVKGIMIGSVKG